MTRKVGSSNRTVAAQRDHLIGNQSPALTSTFGSAVSVGRNAQSAVVASPSAAAGGLDDEDGAATCAALLLRKSVRLWTSRITQPSVRCEGSGSGRPRPETPQAAA